MGYKNKEQKREYQRLWVAKRRGDWLFGKCCVECGSIDMLEIDHVNPEYKWKHNFWSYSWEKIHAELDKCQVLCKECHLKKTKVDLGVEAPAEHGTHRAYNKKKCRCTICSEFHRNYISSWRASRNSQ